MDAAVIWNGTRGDIVLQGDDLLADGGLATAVILSLCSDGRAGAEDVLPGGNQGDVLARRGWWGAEASGWGSLLWLLQRDKTTAKTATRAEEYARASLKWMVDDGVAGAVNATAEIVDSATIGLRVSIQRGNKRQYDYLWRAMENDSYIAELTLKSG